MNSGPRLVLDANILLCAVFGVRVHNLLEAYEDGVGFHSPAICFEEARKHVPAIASRRRVDEAAIFVVLDQLVNVVEPVDSTLYERHEVEARARIRSRDPDDWPIVAVSLLLDCPV